MEVRKNYSTTKSKKISTFFLYTGHIQRVVHTRKCATAIRGKESRDARCSPRIFFFRRRPRHQRAPMRAPERHDQRQDTALEFVCCKKTPDSPYKNSAHAHAGERFNREEKRRERSSSQLSALSSQLLVHLFPLSARSARRFFFVGRFVGGGSINLTLDIT